MASLQMRGCYPLTDEKIDEVVTRTEPGNFALGYLDGGTFIVFYVGRSDSDVNDSLRHTDGYRRKLHHHQAVKLTRRPSSSKST